MDSKEIHKAMKERAPVVCDGIRYDYITEYVAWYNSLGQLQTTVRMVDKNTRCLVSVQADRVQLAEERN